MTALPTIRVEEIAAHADFRRLASVVGISHDLRYAGSDNFAGRVLYRGIDCAWLRAEAAAGLAASATWLARAQPGHVIVVLDALRPQRVQEAIWRDVAGTPGEHYFAHPVRGSVHSFGMAVDVTLRDAEGRELHMGSGFDEMTLLSHPALEAEHLAAGVLTRAHIEARELLRGAMAAGGFVGIPNEWWHFDHGDRERVRHHFARVL